MLIDCYSIGSSCSTGLEAGISCTGTICTQGDIRLQGGTATRGRVEVCNNNLWGTVCDRLWNENNTVVACRQLGLATAGEHIMYVEIMVKPWHGYGNST
jgi:hypothetical protein